MGQVGSGDVGDVGSLRLTSALGVVKKSNLPCKCFKRPFEALLKTSAGPFYKVLKTFSKVFTVKSVILHCFVVHIAFLLVFEDRP